MYSLTTDQLLILAKPDCLASPREFEDVSFCKSQMFHRNAASVFDLHCIFLLKTSGNKHMCLLVSHCVKASLLFICFWFCASLLSIERSD